MSKTVPLKFNYHSDYYRVRRTNCVNPEDNQYGKYYNLIHKDLLEEKTINKFYIKDTNFIKQLSNGNYIRNSINSIPFKITESVPFEVMKDN